MALEAELQTYKSNLKDLLSHEGRYVLIRDDSVLGIFDTYNDAIGAGYEKCELDPFLVKKIQAVDQVLCFHRAFGPCRT